MEKTREEKENEAKQKERKREKNSNWQSFLERKLEKTAQKNKENGRVFDR